MDDGGRGGVQQAGQQRREGGSGVGGGTRRGREWAEEADDAVAGGRSRPVGELGDGLGAELRRGGDVGGVGGEGGGVGGLAEAEVGVEDAEEDGFVGEGFGDERGEGRVGGDDGGVVDGEGGFADDEGIGVVEEFCDNGILETAEGEDEAETDGARIGGHRGGEGGDVVAADKTEHEGVADVFVLVVVRAEGGDECGRGGGVVEFAEGLRGEEFYAGRGIFEGGDEGVGGGGVAGVAENLDRLGADFGVGVAEEGAQRSERGGIFLSELAEGPDGVESGVGRRGRRCGDAGERREAGGTALGEGELGFLADALIGVGEEYGEFGYGGFGPVLRDEFLRCDDEGVFGVLRIADGVDAAAFGFRPTIGPVGSVEAAVGAEFHVGGQRGGEKRLGVGDGVAGTLGFHVVGVDTALRDAAFEVGDEEAAAVAVVETGAGVVGEAGGTVLDVADGGKDVGGGVLGAGLPELFGEPRTVFVDERVLVADAPAAVAALDDMDEALFVALVAIVVAGEEVAVFGKREGLGIAEAAGEHFELGAVRVAAIHGTFVGGVGEGAVGALGVGAAVAVGEIEFAVGAEDEAVKIVAGKIETHAVAAADFLARLGFLFAGEFPDAGDAGEVNAAAAGEDAGGDAVERGVETLGVEGGFGGDAGAVGVFEEADALGLDGKFFDALGPEVAGDGGGLVFEGAVGELVFEGPHVVADIEDAGAVAVGLGDEDAALFVEVEGDGIGEHGLGGPEGGDEAGRELHALERLLALVGGGRDFGGGDARAHF